MRRTLAKIKASLKASENLRIYGSNIPRSFSYIFRNRQVNLPIQKPKYRPKEDFLRTKNDSRVFADMDACHIEWLYSFADSVFSNNSDKHSPFFNPILDISSPGISAFKVYRSTSDFVQVQVTKILNYKGLFQLDYYESSENSADLKTIILCDMSDISRTLFDIVYGVRSLENLENARKICTAFRSVLIYFRPWDYSIGNNYCEITPLFDTPSVESWCRVHLSLL